MAPDSIGDINFSSSSPITWPRYIGFRLGLLAVLVSATRRENYALSGTIFSGVAVLAIKNYYADRYPLLV